MAVNLRFLICKGLITVQVCSVSQAAASLIHPRLGSQWGSRKSPVFLEQGESAWQRAIIGCLGRHEIVLVQGSNQCQKKKYPVAAVGGAVKARDPVLSPSQVSLFTMDLIRQLPQSKRVIIRSSHSPPRCKHQRAENRDSNKYLYTNVHSSASHNHPKVERAQMSISR